MTREWEFFRLLLALVFEERNLMQTFHQVKNRVQSAEQPFCPVGNELCSWLGMRLTWFGNLVQRGASMLCSLRRDNITSVFVEYHSWHNSFMWLSTKHRLLRKSVNSSTSLVWWFLLYSLAHRVSDDLSPTKRAHIATDFPCPINHCVIIFFRVSLVSHFTKLHAWT